MAPKFPEELRWRLERAVSHTVQVETRDGAWSGAGVIIESSGVILTARHIVGRRKSVLAKPCRLARRNWNVLCGKGLLCDVVHEDRSLDMAILKMRRPPAGLRPAVLGDSDRMGPDDPVWRVGRDDEPLDGGWIIKIGHQDGVPEFKIGMKAQPGSSGGPVFNAAGQVIAIALKYHGLKTEPQACYALPINIVKKSVLEIDRVRAVIDEIR